MKRVVLRTVLLALGAVLNRAARRHVFRTLLARHDAIARIPLKDGSVAWHDIISRHRVHAVAGIHQNPTVRMVFKDVDTALAMMRSRPHRGEVVHAAKNFKVMVTGADHLCAWFTLL